MSNWIVLYNVFCVRDFRSFLCAFVCERMCSRLQFTIITHFVWDAIYRKEQKNFETMTMNDDGKIWKMPMDESVDLKNAFVLLGPRLQHTRTHNHNVRDNETDVQKEIWTNIRNTIFYLPGFCFRYFERTRFLVLLVIRSERIAKATHCLPMCVCYTLNSRYVMLFEPFWAFVSFSFLVRFTHTHTLSNFIYRTGCICTFCFR